MGFFRLAGSHWVDSDSAVLEPNEVGRNASGRFKIGNGQTTWADLPYEADVVNDVESAARAAADLLEQDLTRTVNAKTDDYTLALVDQGAVVTMSKGSANVLTIPANATVALPVGSYVEARQIGAGATTVTGATGVTVNGSSGGSVVIGQQYAGVLLLKTATNTWQVVLTGTLLHSSAYTQTYATADRTVPNATAVAVATTAATNVTPYGFAQAQADAIVTNLNALIDDVLALKKVVNALIDDGQAGVLPG